MSINRFLPLLILATSLRCDAAEPLRIACVGDSITYGACVEDRDNNSYPKVLENILRADLGPAYEVKNFGSNGATQVKDGIPAYVQTQEYPAAQAYNPNVVIIMLGTNDSKAMNWSKKDHFAADLADLVAVFAKLPAKPRIWVMLPPPAYSDGWGINGTVIEHEVLPLIRQEATKEHIPVIDIFTLMAGHKDWFAEGIHPNALGAKQIASCVAKTLEPTFTRKN
jgi:lysophospholipase L1-like esterase